MSAGRSEPIGEPTMTPAEVAAWTRQMKTTDCTSPVVAGGEVSSRPTAQIKATGPQRPEAHKDGRGSSSPSGVFGDPLSSPRPSCPPHRFVLPTPVRGLSVVDGVCRLCGATREHRLYPEEAYWGVKGTPKPLTMRGSRHYR